ncbi:hypothetical protein OG407_02695 [Streptomyces sp. NBC_01515]|uniref:hypothetical protein n=1 Tax=Streptomyces sp. NBC_01515 TaxID=2903890 RepID=UPI003864DFA6
MKSTLGASGPTGRTTVSRGSGGLGVCVVGLATDWSAHAYAMSGANAVQRGRSMFSSIIARRGSSTGVMKFR